MPQSSRHRSKPRRRPVHCGFLPSGAASAARTVSRVPRPPGRCPYRAAPNSRCRPPRRRTERSSPAVSPVPSSTFTAPVWSGASCTLSMPVETASAACWRNSPIQSRSVWSVTASPAVTRMAVTSAASGRTDPARPAAGCYGQRKPQAPGGQPQIALHARPPYAPPRLASQAERLQVRQSAQSVRASCRRCSNRMDRRAVPMASQSPYAVQTMSPSSRSSWDRVS